MTHLNRMTHLTNNTAALPRNIDACQATTWRHFKRRCFGGERTETAQLQNSRFGLLSEPPALILKLDAALGIGANNDLGHMGAMRLDPTSVVIITCALKLA